MRVINVLQRSEEWDRLRARPTASEFGKFVTPAKGDYSTQATGYAAKIVAKQLGVYTEPPPSWAMERGTELEPSAKLAYTLATKREIQEVGFVIPDGTDSYGCSPDGLVGDDGIIEVKCPLAETLIAYHADGVLPLVYKPQVQGQLLITGRKWCDFYVFHEELEPFLLRIKPDEEYQAKIADGLLLLLKEIEDIKVCVSKQKHKLVTLGSMQTDVKFDDEG